MSLAQLEKFRVTDLVKLEAGEAVGVLLRRAAQLQASDLFILSDERYVTIALRRLGSMEKIAVVSTDHGRQMISHIKAHAEMDIAQRRRPADGRWIHHGAGFKLDIRVNCTPTLYGEDVTLRLWNHATGLFALDQLGLERGDLHKLLLLLDRPSGLLLVTGPTGTGKSTTLYACLQHLADGSRKINTLEDPVEYAVAEVRQSQINPRLGLDFPQLLRHVLRQAPDVIMIGEIRDQDTATTAVRAANSGQLVLATLHAPTPGAAVQNMLALGAHPHFLASCLLGVVAQRLVRTLCENCRIQYDISDSPRTFDEVRTLLDDGQGDSIWGPRGCPDCLHLGYQGRSGLFEVMTTNQETRRLVAAAASSAAIEDAAVRAGMLTFRQLALLKVAHGVTSTEEILRDVPPEQLGLEE